MAQRMIEILAFVAYICLCWSSISVIARESVPERFCVCFESQRSNWITGTEAGLCFGREFLEKGKNETCNPDIDATLCRDQRLQNLALTYVTDLKQFNKFLGISTTAVPTRGTMRNNLKKMVDRYDRFFKYHPAVMDVCEPYEFHKYETLQILSTFKDFGRSHHSDRDLPAAVAMVDGYLIAYKLQKEVDRVCDESPASNFCLEMRQFDRIIRKCGDLLRNARSFPREIREEAIRAYQLNFVPFILKYPHWTRIEPSSETERVHLYQEFTEKLVTYMVSKDFKRLETLMQFLPGYEDMRDCKTYQEGDYCLFKVGTDQVYMKTFWKQAVLEKLRSSKETFRIVRDFLADEIQETAVERMDELKNYFNQVEGYNRKIASADMAYLEGMMSQAFSGFHQSKREVMKLTGELKEKIYEMTIHTLWWDLFGLTASLFTTGLDPRKWVQGNAVADLIETGNELLATGANLRAIGALGESMMNVFKQIKAIYSGVLDNSHFLRRVRQAMPSSNSDMTSEEFNHAKRVFLQNYTDYSPKVREHEITKAGEMFNSIVDQLCAMIDDARGPWAYIVAGQVHYHGNCYKLMSSISTMTSFNEQIYELQFEYMDSLAEYLRTSTAQYAANEINSNLYKRSTDPSLTLLRSMAVGAFFTHEIQKWQIMEDYCDTLEYRNGGKRPAICKGISTDFPSLIAYLPKECDSDVEQIVDIPAQENTSGKKPDSSTIYLNALLNGSAQVFQVPNRQWLVKNKWISQADVNSAIFVKNFQLFLPAVHRRYKHIKTVVTAAINKLYPEGPVYGIKPPAAFVSDYGTGAANLGCRIPPIESPYSTCKSQKLPRICQTTISEKEDNFQTATKYPSIYASWSIQTFGYEKYTVNEYATPFVIKAKVQLCKVRDRIPPISQDVDGDTSKATSSTTRKELEELLKVSPEVKAGEEGSSQDKWGCCYGNTYFKASENKCEECPASSRKALKGYACFKRSTG